MNAKLIMAPVMSAGKTPRQLRACEIAAGKRSGGTDEPREAGIVNKTYTRELLPLQLLRNQRAIYRITPAKHCGAGVFLRSLRSVTEQWRIAWWRRVALPCRDRARSGRRRLTAIASSFRFARGF